MWPLNRGAVSVGGNLATVVTPQNPPAGAGLVRDIVIYSVARLALVGLLTLVLLQLGIPMLVAVLLALVVALPLAWVLLRTLRMRVSAGLHAAAERRRAERDRLREQLRG